jgi:hypothetical protein
MGDRMTLLALQDLFRHRRDRSTGLWKLGVEPNRTIYFDTGDIVFAQSTHPMDRLTFLLVERGKLTQAQLDYALANLKPGLSIGKNLIEMGFITQRDLLEVALAQVERVVQGALGTPEVTPTFESRELDATVVRLPLDTPQLLLNGMLNLQDRERLLELLGPLNQVVVLQGRRLMEMNLPADLAKLPPLLDGTHTLLELSREALAEPLRLGTFALFLREIGWARLHEMPPLDRQALDMALTAELEPLAPPMPEPPVLDTVPSLFSTIEAAARPTTNLEHLSHALDALPEVVKPPMAEPPHELFPPEEDRTPETPAEPEPPRKPAAQASRLAPMPDPSGFTAESGQALLPTPSMELPEPPFAKDELPEPKVTLRPSTMNAESEAPALPAPKSRLLTLVGALVLVALAGGGWWWFKMRPAPKPPVVVSPPKPPKVVNPGVAVPTPAPPVAQNPEPPKPEPPKPEPPKPEPPRPEPPKAEPPKPEPPKPEPPKVAPPKPVNVAVGTSMVERDEALLKGNLDLAIQQGLKYLKDGPGSHWTLRLEIACQGDTLRHAVEVFPESKADLFVIPIVLQDGRTCYQVFYGKFPSRGAAEKQSPGLPKPFLEGGNHPKAFRLDEVPARQ